MGTTLLCLWFHVGRREQCDRHVSLVALAMLLVIMFPVISVSDDLWSVHNPAETDTCQRRNHRDLAPTPASRLSPHFLCPQLLS